MKTQQFLLALNSPLRVLMAVLVFAGCCFAGDSAQILYRFQGSSDGYNPYSNLIWDQAGNLYGTTEYGGTSFYGEVFQLSPPSKAGALWKKTTLYSFTNTGDGARPTDGMIFDNSGNLYGTTSDSAAGGYGEIFQLTPPLTKGGAWREKVLYHFQGGTDGNSPRGGLISDENGNLYGTTFNSVFELSPPAQQGGAWTFTLVHELSGGLTDGKSSQAGLVRDLAGHLYGTTLWGGYEGNGFCGSIGCGTVFEVSPPATSGGAWTEQVIHFFGMGTDGFDPEGGLVLDAKGNLYGTTYSGGAANSGTAFRLSPPSQAGGTWTEGIIHSFSYTLKDGAAPTATMIMDTAGNLYGTAMFGGTPCFFNGADYGCGVVFELSPAGGGSAEWNETVLYFFPRPYGNARHPAASLLFDAVGNLYGTSAYGGVNACISQGEGCGTVFEIVR
ncbi:MAG TPA: choice-of-anchor tandem repeat GloVer-containing protein [Candidatus Acidoferrum sp.]|jgi:uncharacterized repeat protein (TIGR03803 family)|nr:choice-of-anchor tandem repeat GloVer-containing protein [Candidatus Acidoferrum sp.]